MASSVLPSFNAPSRDFEFNNFNCNFDFKKMTCNTRHHLHLPVSSYYYRSLSCWDLTGVFFNYSYFFVSNLRLRKFSILFNCGWYILLSFVFYPWSFGNCINECGTLSFLQNNLDFRFGRSSAQEWLLLLLLLLKGALMCSWASEEKTPAITSLLTSTRSYEPNESTVSLMRRSLRGAKPYLLHSSLLLKTPCFRSLFCQKIMHLPDGAWRSWWRYWSANPIFYDVDPSCQKS